MPPGSSMLGLAMLSCLARSSASSSRACRACQRACPGDVLARSHARYPGPSRRDAHARRPEPSASPRRMHRAQAGVACVPLQCTAAVCRLLTSAPYTRVLPGVVCATRAYSPHHTRVGGPRCRRCGGQCAAAGGGRYAAVGGGRRWAVAGTCALSFFSMVLYWLTRADCDLEIFFSPSSPVSAIRFSLTALAWTGQKGRHHRPGLRAPGTTAAPHFGVHAAALASGAGEGSAGPAGGPRAR